MNEKERLKKEGRDIYEYVLKYVLNYEYMTTSEIAEKCGLTQQKISPQLRKLVADGLAVETKIRIPGAHSPRTAYAKAGAIPID